MTVGILVPLVRQSYDYSCGAACLASCLYYWGVWAGREPELYPLLNTNPTEGTTVEALVAGAQAYGLSAQYQTHLTVTALDNYLADGYTIILNLQAWGSYGPDTDFSQVWQDGHYVVLVNRINTSLTLMDPSVAGQYAIMSIAEFDQRWHDWSDEGEDREYHTAILLKGESPVDLTQPLRIDSTHIDTNT